MLKSPFQGLRILLLLLATLSAVPLHALAPNIAGDAQEARLARLEQQSAGAKASADNAWMLTSAALVLMMTGPGLALFYGGLVRKKNVLATMMQSFGLMAVVTVLWELNHRRPASPLPARRWRCARGRIRSDDPAPDLHDLPVDVRHHHTCADYRSLCRAHEVQRHDAVHDPVVAACI
jgi:hypothetical protein